MVVPTYSSWVISQCNRKLMKAAGGQSRMQSRQQLVGPAVPGMSQMLPIGASGILP
jgi:hypothetical protein